jgi:hypothetical protein
MKLGKSEIALPIFRIYIEHPTQGSSQRKAQS